MCILQTLYVTPLQNWQFFILLQKVDKNINEYQRVQKRIPLLKQLNQHSQYCHGLAGSQTITIRQDASEQLCWQWGHISPIQTSTDIHTEDNPCFFHPP